MSIDLTVAMTENNDQNAPADPPAAENTQPNEATAEANPHSTLEQELAQAQEKLAAMQDQFLRAKAETENARRRALADLAAAQKFAVESFSGELLSVIDSLEAAASSNNATTESMKSGVELTLRQLLQVFEKFKIAQVNPVGEKFDPHKHQAISMIAAPQPANTVVSVLQKGYTLHERVLRPAMVAVSNGAGTPATAADNGTST